MQTSEVEQEEEQIDTSSNTRQLIRNKTHEGQKRRKTMSGLDEKEREQRAVDAQEEMMDYLKQMIQFICTGDEKTDHENMELLADGIYDRALQLYETYKKKMNYDEMELRKTQALKDEETKDAGKKKDKKKEAKEQQKKEKQTKQATKNDKQAAK